MKHVWTKVIINSKVDPVEVTVVCELMGTSVSLQGTSSHPYKLSADLSLTFADPHMSVFSACEGAPERVQARPLHRAQHLPLEKALQQLITSHVHAFREIGESKLGVGGVTNAPIWCFNIQLAPSREAARHQHRDNLTTPRRSSFIFTAAGTLHVATGTPPEVWTDSCFTFVCLLPNFSRLKHYGSATDGHRRSGTACKYVLWRRWSCGFWRRSSLWSPIFSFLSPVVCSVIGPLWECLKQNWRICWFSGGFGIVPHYASIAPKRWAGKKWRNSSSVFHRDSPLKLRLHVVVCLCLSSRLLRRCVALKHPHASCINILTCLAAWTLPAPVVYTCVLRQCVRQVVNWTFSPPCSSFTLIRCGRGGKRQRGETSCLLFLLPVST